METTRKTAEGISSETFFGSAADDFLPARHLPHVSRIPATMHESREKLRAAVAAIAVAAPKAQGQALALGRTHAVKVVQAMRASERAVRTNVTAPFRTFWSGFGFTVAVSLAGAAAVLFAAFYTEPVAPNAAGVVAYDATHDPFETASAAVALAPLFSATPQYLYRESLPFGYEGWAWGASVDWRSDETASEGRYALATSIQDVWGGVGMSGPERDVGAYRSLFVSVYVSEGIDEVTIELYGADGEALGSQPLSWYLPERTVMPGVWKTALIPLENLFPAGGASVMSGISFSASAPGTLYIDDIRLSEARFVRARYEDAPEATP